MAVYLDCNATTPMEPKVAAVVRRYMEEEYGNAASAFHQYGEGARMAVETARGQVARLLKAHRDEVIFTSGATEANNLALLGHAYVGELRGKRHIITTAIEHPSVIEPLQQMAKNGFEITVLLCTAGGWVDPDALRRALRADTLLVSVMQVNNETGIRQPIESMAAVLADHPASFHVDAAQGFGKEQRSLQHPRIDMISVSGHKIYGPKGVGALVVRKQQQCFPALRPIMYGGSQEQGMRAGTLPTALIAGLGSAAAQARRDQAEREESCRNYRNKLLDGLAPLDPIINGDTTRSVPHAINLSLPGISNVDAVKALKDTVAISGGSACTAHAVEPSHVLLAMGLSQERIGCALRFAWCHMTPPVDWHTVIDILKKLRH
ncbi:cysteine desulfurase family protein [Desulfurispira natronophila]|uniref:cysteine desulfurase n=1 Tax=Desulfurispira natronophila TaxID=682562 RepID=A0A7W7Y3H5_9BACT|nr:aminotransferase class V-fold PLP-dependent enzyme [Desulfurispira natronophila]MBB5021416.1 cysteine desulfurase [Desulfurispira natronophila]